MTYTLILFHETGMTHETLDSKEDLSNRIAEYWLEENSSEDFLAFPGSPIDFYEGEENQKWYDEIFEKYKLLKKQKKDREDREYRERLKTQMETKKAKEMADQKLLEEIQFRIDRKNI